MDTNGSTDQRISFNGKFSDATKLSAKTTLTLSSKPRLKTLVSVDGQTKYLGKIMKIGISRFRATLPWPIWKKIIFLRYGDSRPLFGINFSHYETLYKLWYWWWRIGSRKEERKSISWSVTLFLEKPGTPRESNSQPLDHEMCAIPQCYNLNAALKFVSSYGGESGRVTPRCLSDVGSIPFRIQCHSITLGH